MVFWKIDGFIKYILTLPDLYSTQYAACPVSPFMSCFLNVETIQGGGGILIKEIRYFLPYLLFLSTSQWVEIRIHNHFGPIVLAYVLARFVHLHSFHDFLFRLVIIHIDHTLKCHFYANLFSGFSVGEIFHQTKRFYAYLACLFSSCLFLVCT